MRENIMGVALLDLTRQYEQFKNEVEAAVIDVCRSGKYILGETVAQFEREAAAYCGAGAAVGLTSGSDALLVALMDRNVGPGDEVITTPFTFFATVGAITRLGATPVFVDIDPRSYNLDQDAAIAALTDKTKAVIIVHLFGRWAECDRLLAVCEERGIALIEDAAQAIGCANAQGRRAGSVGHYGAFSFFPSKNLGAFGDGGLLTCRDEETAQRLRVLRNHGQSRTYYHDLIGGNFRLDALQAAVLSVKLKHLEGWHAGRRANAEKYREAFEIAGVPAGAAELPAAGAGRHIYNQLTLRAQRRDELLAYLRENGIGCAVYYPLCLHLQPCFAFLGLKPGAFPHAEAASAEVISIPVYPELTAEEIMEVSLAIAGFYKG